MIRTTLDKDNVLSHDTPVGVSPAFPAAPASVSLSEQPHLTKTRPLLRSKNGLQPPVGTQPGFPGPPQPAQRIGKRRFSMGVGFKGLAKRRRRVNSDSQSDPVLPSHFLLGGNIFDPLNLNSLLDEDVNRATNQETPKCSPLPSRGGDPVEILVPRDITDPLNLKGGGRDGTDGDGGDGVLLSPLKSRRRHRTRHHGGGGAAGEKEAAPARLFPPTVSLLTRDGSVPASPLPCELNTAITCRDDVAPPPILPRRHTHPPPGSAHKSSTQGQRRRRRTASARSSDAAANAVAAVTAKPTRFQTPLVGGAKAGDVRHDSARRPQRRKDGQRYQHGNHSRYYGYRGFYGNRWEGRIGVEDDPRLRLLEAEWFRGKRVLDVGCGAGHVTLAVARWFSPAHILGVELDGRLVHAANRNILHFLSHDVVVAERGRSLPEAPPSQRKEAKARQAFPLSFRLTRGPLAAPPLLPAPSLCPPSHPKFPHNITFIQGDYVSQREAWPGRGQYDIILCLGVTKWVQLQSGDVGVARLFRRAYQSLSPDGLLVLEAQPWRSYSRSKRASENTFRQYRGLRLRPEQFTSFLTDNVGFTSYRLLKHTGNHRPIYLFHKGSAHRH